MFKSARVLSAKKTFLVAYDALSSLLSIIAAMYIRFDGIIPVDYIDHLKAYWFVYPILALIAFHFTGAYDQMWVFAGVQQMLIIPSAVLIQTLGTLAAQQLIGLSRAPYSVNVLYFFLFSTLSLAIRAIYKWYSLHVTTSIQSAKDNHGVKPHVIRVLVVGAGKAGAQLINELQTRQTLRKPVAIVDDNPYTQTYKSRGVPVLGNRHDIKRLVERLKIDEIIIAIPRASKGQIKEIIDICHTTSAKVHIVPGIPEIIEGSVNLGDVREVQIEDLLGREPVKLDLNSIANSLRDKVVLITGGGGSIGSEIARQVAKFHPKQLVLFDVYENNVYDLQQELKHRYGTDLNLLVQIGSVRDQDRLQQLFSDLKPNYVFHAAAHKHVPLMQDSPCDAVKNNIFGTWNVADMAGKYQSDSFVLISTDKAVNPTNVMGSTKRIAEMITTILMDEKYPNTKFAAVRFGNVLGSSGSVVPLFTKQIKEERRVTVTHPDIKRYFMTIPEASRLVLQAGALAKGGEIFVLDMGEPVKIVDLARSMIKLSGLKPDIDVPIDFIGLRPGEKMFEELSLDQESVDSTAHGKIFIVRQQSDVDTLKHEIHDLASIINCDIPRFAEIQQVLPQVLTKRIAEQKGN